MANALAVGLERGAGGPVGDDDQPLALDVPGGEVEERHAGGVLAGAEAGVEDAAAAGAMQAGVERELMAGLVGDAQVVPDADGEGDIVIVEELQPLGADELAVAQEEADARDREMRQIAVHQRDAVGARAAAAVGQQRPEERHAPAPGDRGEHRVVHLAPADLPVGAVEHQGPALGPERGRQQRRGPVRREGEELEEPLQPPIRGGRLHPPAARGGDVPEVHRPRADRADDQEAEGLEPALAQGDVGP
jgi:hypothetical protein